MSLVHKPFKQLLIVEGNHEGLVQISDNGQIIGAAERYGAVLQNLEETVKFQVTRPHFQTDPAPPVDWQKIDGVVFTGAGVYWSADAPEAKPARAIMEATFKQGLPVFGSCYGMQLGVVVLGGTMQANPAGAEIAIARNIQLTSEGCQHPIYQGKPTRFDALCMHRDDVRDPGHSIQVLSANAHCAVQAVAAVSGDIRFWGVQYHPELHFSDIANFLARSDIKEFSKLAEGSGLGVPADIPLAEMIADFRALDKEEALDHIKARYNISSVLANRKIHESELSNWLASF